MQAIRKTRKKLKENVDDKTRWKFAGLLAIFVILAGVIYFFVKAFLDKKNEKEKEQCKTASDCLIGEECVEGKCVSTNFIVRECNLAEIVSDEPCGRRIKTPAGKFCCLA